MMWDVIRMAGVLMLALAADSLDMLQLAAGTCALLLVGAFGPMEGRRMAKRQKKSPDRCGYSDQGLS